MFGRNLIHTRIRAAEAALADGRVDEAYACAADPALRGHPKAQALADGLVRPLLARARLAAARGDWRAALADLDRLQALGREGDDGRQLRQRVLTEMQSRQQDANARQAAAARVAENLRAGRLDSGRVELERVADLRDRARLEGEIVARTARLAEAMEQAESALKQDDFLAAARIWDDGTRKHGRTDESDELGRRIASGLAAQAESWWAAGRLDRIFAAEAAIGALEPVAPGISPLGQLLTLARVAVGELGREQFGELRRTVLRLQGLRSAKWLEQLAPALQEIARQVDALWASPLGAMAQASVDRTMEIPEGALLPDEPRPRDTSPRAVQPASPRGTGGLLLLIDGGGSSLWLTGDRVRIGRAGSSGARVEIPLPADVEAHHADIVRAGDDYFIVAQGGRVSVNHQSVARALLRDGDHVRLGGHAKFTFQKPSQRSGSAVLQLHHRCRLPHDVSAVVLFRDTALVGPQAGCHVRTREGTNQAVVFTQGDRWCVRAAPLGNRGVLGDVKQFRMNETLTVGDLRLTAAAYDDASPAAGRKE